MGTRIMWLKMPCSPRTVQKDLLFLRNCTTALRLLSTRSPRRRGDRLSSNLAEDSSGRQVSGLGRIKSKIRCRAGPTPVAKVDQATGEIAGRVVSSFLKLPVFFNPDKWGSSPAAIMFSQTLGSRPSKPSRITRSTELRGRLSARKTRRSRRNGSVSSVSSDNRSETNKVKADEISAKPAPGPM